MAGEFYDLFGLPPQQLPLRRPHSSPSSLHGSKPEFGRQLKLSLAKILSVRKMQKDVMTTRITDQLSTACAWTAVASQGQPLVC